MLSKTSAVQHIQFNLRNGLATTHVMIEAVTVTVTVFCAIRVRLVSTTTTLRPNNVMLWEAKRDDRRPEATLAVTVLGVNGTSATTSQSSLAFVAQTPSLISNSNISVISCGKLKAF